MALDVEDIIDGGMGRQKSLSRSGTLEALHLALSSTGRLMRIPGAIVRPPVGLMATFNAQFSGRGGIRCESVGRHSFRDEAILLQKLAHEFQRSRLVSLGLNQDVQDLALGVDGAPEVDHAASDLQIHLIEMPRRMRSWSAFS